MKKVMKYFYADRTKFYGFKLQVARLKLIFPYETRMN